jgi:hypothetical protein
MGSPGIKSCSDNEFISLFNSIGAQRTAQALGITERNVYGRRERLEKRYGSIDAPTRGRPTAPGRVPYDIKSGVVIIGSDFHIWPGAESTCLRAFKKFVADLKPAAVILNGDVMDFPRISRHPQSWESAPDPQEEIEAVQDHLNDIVKACKRGTQKFWTLGNHDARLESLYANSTPQMRGMKGVHLHDHFSGVWQRAMSCFINEGVEGGATMVKHRYKGGMNATRANALNAGVSVVTGHLHCQNVRPVSDYGRYDRYGVDTGCVADKDHRAFSYTEDSPLDWRSGFAILTYRDGRLLYPELVTKWDDKHVQFRGKLIKC